MVWSPLGWGKLTGRIPMLNERGPAAVGRK